MTGTTPQTVNLPHGTARTSDMSAEIVLAWHGDRITEHDLSDDGGSMTWRLFRDDEVHAEYDDPSGDNDGEILHDAHVVIIGGRAYGITLASYHAEAVSIEAPSPTGFQARVGLGLSAMMTSITRGNYAEAERVAYTLSNAQHRAAMLAVLGRITYMLATSPDLPDDAPLVIDPRINGIQRGTMGGFDVLEIYTNRSNDAEILTITAEGEYVSPPA